MTKQQQKMATENHNLIFEFLKYYKLPYEEFYDLAAIGLCKGIASNKFDGNRGSLSTFLFRCMYNEVANEKRKYYNLKHNRGEKELSLEYEYTGLDNTPQSIKEVLQAPGNFEQTMSDIMMFEQILGKQKREHQEIIRLIIRGYTYVEVGKIKNLSKQRISQIMNKFREELLEAEQE